MFDPNIILSFLGFESTTEIWIRVLGIFTSSVGIYYLISAKNEQLAFFRASIIGRVFFFVSLAFVTLMFEQKLMLILFGIIELIGAFWTYLALRSNE